MASLMDKVKNKMHHPSQKEATPGQGESVSGTEPIPQSVEQAPATSQDATEDTSPNTLGNNGGLQFHNDARSQKNVPALEWDESLASGAEKYAQKLAKKNTMQHSGQSGVGENLYMSSADASFEDAVQAWLNEEKDYHGEKIGEGDFGKWGHFSQCLWHSTTHVGMGKGRTDQGATYIVGRYSPQGNMAGEKPF